MDVLICLPLDLQFTVLKIWFLDGCNMSNWNEYFSAGIPLHWFEYAKLNWEEISAQPLLNEFILTFEHMLDWKVLSARNELDENLMRKHAEELDWSRISGHKLSIQFLRDFKEKIIWKHFPYYRYRSNNFKTIQLLISEFGGFIDWTKMIIYSHYIIDDNFIDLNISRIDITLILNSISN